MQVYNYEYKADHMLSIINYCAGLYRKITGTRCVFIFDRGYLEAGDSIVLEENHFIDESDPDYKIIFTPRKKPIRENLEHEMSERIHEFIGQRCVLAKR